MITSQGLHVFVFCCVEYQHLLDYCVRSIRQHVQDPILDLVVVSNARLPPGDYRVIQDQDFWRQLDLDGSHDALYKANWTRQQIFKLSVDRLVQGHALIVDAEVLFLRPTQWLHHGRGRLYTSLSPHHEPYFNLIHSLLGLRKCHAHSFITDAMLFDTEVLQSLRRDIETHTGRAWMHSVHDLLTNHQDQVLSEFELYGTYVMTKHPWRVHAVSDPIPRILTMDDRQSYDFDTLLDLVRQQLDLDYVSVNINEHSHTGSGTAWLTFWNMVRDPAWPHCDRESDFHDLPPHIQRECIEVHGYVPKCDVGRARNT